MGMECPGQWLFISEAHKQAYCEQGIILLMRHYLRELKLCQTIEAWGALRFFSNSADESPREVQSWKDNK